MNRWTMYEFLKKKYMETGKVVDVPSMLNQIRESSSYPDEYFEEAMEGYQEFTSMIGHQ